MPEASCLGGLAMGTPAQLLPLLPRTPCALHMHAPHMCGMTVAADSCAWNATGATQIAPPATNGSVVVKMDKAGTYSVICAGGHCVCG